MRLFVIFCVLFVTVHSIVFDEDSSSGSHESSYYSGGGGGNHGHHDHNGGRPPRPPRPPVTERPETKCEPGWTRVNRQSGGWCVKIFAGMTNQPQAESFCAQHGARLSAVESHEERETIAELGRVVMTTTSAWKFGTLRTGIKRDTLHSPFYVTDGNAKDLNAVKWSGGEPNQGSYGGGGNNCGMMWIWVPGGKQVQQRRHGEFFSMVCHMSWNDRFRGYVCGKTAV